jgi:hypothetical protein
VRSLRNVRIVLMLCLWSVALAGDAAVTTFSGEVLHGPLGEAGPDRVRVGAQEVALADVDSLVLAAGRAPSVVGELGVQLGDGSWLPAATVAGATLPDVLVVTGPLGVLEIPLAAIAGWGDPAVPPAGTGDAIVVASGLLRGRFLGLRDGKVTFAPSLDPEPLVLPLIDVRAVRLAAPPLPSSGLRLRVLPDAARPPLDLLLRGGRPVLAAAPTVVVDPARLGGLPLRVEGGRRVYLSDLKPVRRHEVGAFGVVWPFATDTAIGGGPLRLGGTRFAKGLTVHAAAEMAWDLAAGFQRLRACVGIADQLLPEGDCVAFLTGDGRELWRSRVRSGEQPRVLDLELSGVRELVLHLELGERNDIGDHLVLADAQLIRRP